MNFNTVPFLFLFLPIVLLVFYNVPIWFRTAVLAVGSIIFYAVSGLVPAGLLVGTIAFGFAGAVLQRAIFHKSVLFLAMSVSIPLGVLFLFKYLNFTLTVFNADEPVWSFFSTILQVTIPAGISFYTFQIVSYLVDVRDGRIASERSLVRFAAFISFFPQLIAGPIMLYSQIQPQLIRIETERYLSPNLSAGLKYLTVGLMYKIFFADILQIMLTPGESISDGLWLVFAYSFIIYFDFWGYSLMAIGIAKMFSIELPRNFREPYLSHSPKDFWKRWHVTLSFWLRDYLYIRLGGKNKYVRNIAIVFIAAGIWHGAGWSFIVWGVYHGFFVIIYHATRKYWDAVPRLISISVTFLIVSFSWPLFFMSIGDYHTWRNRAEWQLSLSCE